MINTCFMTRSSSVTNLLCFFSPFKTLDKNRLEYSFKFFFQAFFIYNLPQFISLQFFDISRLESTVLLFPRFSLLFIDHDRPLSKAGQADAVIVSQKLQQLGWIPELILSRLGFPHSLKCFSDIAIKMALWSSIFRVLKFLLSDAVQ